MKTVLVLEDDPTLCKLLVTYLQRSGYHVLHSFSEATVVQEFEKAESQVHLLIADLTLDGSSGVNIACRLFARNTGMRVLFTSGYPHVRWNEGDRSLLDGFPPGTTQVLLKPFSVQELMSSIAALIGMPDA